MTNLSDSYLLQHQPTQLLKQYEHIVDACIQECVPLKYVPILKKEVEDGLLNELAAYTQKGANLLCSMATLVATLATQVCKAVCEKRVAKALKGAWGDAVNNDLVDVYLLWSRSSRLVLKYERLVKQLVGRQIEGNERLATYRADIEQDVQAYLLEQLAGGKLGNFKGEALFKVYLQKVVIYAILNSIRKLNKPTHQAFALQSTDAEGVPLTDFEPSVDESSNYEHRQQVKRHIDLFEAFLIALKIKIRSRFEFCTKVVYEVLISRPAHIQAHYSQCSNDDFLDILLVFGTDAPTISTEQKFQHLADFLCRWEHKATQPSALKKWYHRTKMKVWMVLFEGDKLLLETKNRAINDYFELLVHFFYQKTN